MSGPAKLHIDIPPRPCRSCSSPDLSLEIVHQQVLDQLRYEADHASSAVRDRRLDICGQCPQLLIHTCARCGCYVEFRASLRHKTCPEGHW